MLQNKREYLIEIMYASGGKVRKVALNDQMKDILESRKHLPHPFPFAYDGVYEKLVRKYYPLAGIIGANLHNLRKTSGGLLIQAGKDIYRVSKFLGHSSVTVTEKHYVDLLRDDYQDMARALGERLEGDRHVTNTEQPISTHSGVNLGLENTGLKGPNRAPQTEVNPRKPSTNDGLQDSIETPAGVVELVDTGDLKSPARKGLPGSSPGPGTWMVRTGRVPAICGANGGIGKSGPFITPLEPS